MINPVTKASIKNKKLLPIVSKSYGYWATNPIAVANPKQIKKVTPYTISHFFLNGFSS